MASRRSAKSAVHSSSAIELMDVDEEEVLSDKHQLMLQYLMSVKMAKESDLSRVHKKLFNNSESLELSLRKIVSLINPLKMDIKNIVCDVGAENYYVFFQHTGEVFFQKSCPFNKAQLDFLKTVLICIASSNTGKITKIEALNRCETLSKTLAQVALKLFIKEKYLIEITRGVLCLSPLSIVEFEPLFKFVFGDNLKCCDLCKRLVFYCITCLGCDKKFHGHCVTKWSNEVSEKNKCPSCKSKWEDDMLYNTDTE